MEDKKEIESIKAFISEDKPIFKRGDKHKIISKESKAVIIRNVYPRRLEDLTFSDLKMIGYDNPNHFVKEWIASHNLFDENKVVWVVVYVEDKE